MKNILSGPHFLDWNDKFHVTTSVAFQRTKNNSGFNFTVENGFSRIYYHAPTTKDLNPGRYIICFTQSKLVSERNDAFAVISEADFKQYVMSEVCSPSLSTQFVQFVKRNTSLIKMVERAVWQKLSQLIASESENERQISQVLSHCTTLKLDSPVLLAQLNSGQICTPELFEEKLIKTQWDKLLPSAIRVRAAKTLFDNFDDVPAQVAVCIQKSILTPEIKALAAKVVIADPVLANSFPLQTFVQLCAATAFNPNKEEFENLFSVVDHQKSKVVAQYLPIELIADFPSYVSLTQLLEHLSMPEISEPESILQQVFARIESNEAEVSKGDIAYLNRTLKKEHLQDSVNAHFKNIDNVKATLLCKLSDSIDLAPQLKSAIRTLLMNFQSDASRCFLGAWRADLAVKYLDDSVREAISQNYSEFLDTFEEGQEVLCEHFPLEHFPRYAKYSSEARFIQFLMLSGEGCRASELDYLNKAASQNDFHQALLLIALLEQKVTRGGASVETIVSIFSIFQKNIFEYHAKTRSKLKLSILPRCAKAKALGRDSSTLTVCEGKLWYLKNVDEKGNVLSETPKTLCRRSDCKHCVFQGMEELEYSAKDYRYGNVPLPPRQHSFGTTHLYQMVNRLFGITAEQLHAHEKYVKAVSALNRWNDILDSLVCQCGEPLHISEHSPHAMGNMAVGATYWHCGNEACSEFCKSVKVSYCIGCQKVIDNRVDIHSCTPFEVKSFKKFYICVDCGSCCLTHKGFSGMCAHCGKDHAYSLVSDRANSICRYCNTKVSMNPFSFKALQEHRSSGGVFNKYQTLSTNSTSHLLLCHPNLSSPLVIDIPQEENKLFVFDLFYALSTGILNREMLSRYQQGDIYDLKVMERMATLGLGHAKYGKQLNTGLLEHIDNLSEGVAFSEVKQVIFERVGFLFQQMTSQDLWHHYNDVEYPFTLALAYLTRDGIRLDKNHLQNQFQALELERNKLVKAMQDMGIDAPKLSNVEVYLEGKYSTTIASDLIAYLQRSNSKSLSHVDPIFPYLSGIEKVERGSAILSQMSKLPSYIKPQYQIVGTVTGRCTAKEPNLLGLPGALRHVIRAELGMSIVECDYKQMEIGVLAALSADQQLITDFNTGDVYEKFGTALAISREQAKVVLLGLIYGMSASTIAIQLGVTNVIAETYINRFFARYPDVKKYQNELVTQGISQGYVTSCTGLRRSVNRHVAKSSAILNWEQNWFKNFPIQASAASVFKLSIVELARELHGEQFKLLVPHYDAIVFEVPEEQTNHYIAQVKAAMHRAMKKQFPMLEPQIDVKSCGKSWGEQVQEMNTSNPYQRQGIDDLPF